ncbi:hypothetical protein BY458DRAFT_506013 [Sporodiniella umbellata]|nr:hypothetical protein BY458DRAFT_506013 [Sporodiniella umbellata]
MFLYFCALSLYFWNLNAQLDENNPSIWQTLVQSNASGTYSLSESSLKVYSPEFQTVFIHKDLYGENKVFFWLAIKRGMIFNRFCFSGGC